MNRKNVFLDPSLWVLIGINVYLVYYYYQHPAIFTTLVWLYWAQSIMLGAFNFLDILTIKRVLAPKKGTSDIFGLKRPLAFFFMFHYGCFHLVYFFFLLGFKSSGPFQWDFFRYFLLAFFFGQAVNFIQHKINQRKEPANIAVMFFTPYLRVVPMHLTILLPNFMPVTNMGVFLILKSVADVLMYLVTNRSNKKSPEMDKSLLATQDSMNL